MSRSTVVDIFSEILGYPKGYSSSNVEIEFNCPKCDNHRNKFNLVLNTDKNVFHCWSCSYRGTAKKLTFDYGDDDQKTRMNSAITLKPWIVRNLQKNDEQNFSVHSFRSLKVEWKDSLNYTAAMKYLRKRRIGKRIIDQWDICYADEGPYSGRIIIPSKDIHGKTEYFVARDIYGTSKLRYKNPPSKKQTVIFGEKFIDWKKPVILTEGVFDAMVLYNAVPLLGSKIEGHNKLIKKIMDNKTPIILGFDEDKAGIEGRIKVAKFLKSVGSSLYIVVDNEYNDLANAFLARGREYIVSLIRNAEPFDELDMKIRTLKL